MKKKGFTLIELLAVIVILAVIALIATPLIMNVINDAKKNSFKDSAYGIMKAVELRAMQEMQNPEGSNPPYKVDVTENGITYSGDKPTSGWAYVDANGNIELYMCNDSFCASKAIDSNEVIITSNSGEMETVTSNIERIENMENVATLTKDGSEGGETTTKGYTYIPNTDSNETYLGILYLDPTDLSATCNEELAAANKQGKDASGNTTLTGTKTGCMRWFAFGENETPTTAILDHNTTAISWYDFDNKNDHDSTRTHDQYEADWEITQLNNAYEYNWKVEARFPTVNELVNVACKESDLYSEWNENYSNAVYFGGGNSTSENGKYWWLYTNLYDVTSYNGHVNDNASYEYFSNSNGETGINGAQGYWTSTAKGDSNNLVWNVRYLGDIYTLPAYAIGIGVRPVISLSSLDLSN